MGKKSKQVPVCGSSVLVSASSLHPKIEKLPAWEGLLAVLSCAWHLDDARYPAEQISVHLTANSINCFHHLGQISSSSLILMAAEEAVEDGAESHLCGTTSATPGNWTAAISVAQLESVESSQLHSSLKEARLWTSEAPYHGLDPYTLRGKHWSRI